jgi:ribonuclease HII
MNIRQAVLKGMRECTRCILEKINTTDVFLLIDGNDFLPYHIFEKDTLINIPHATITGGDNKYVSIACASILAKTARDEYIHELCQQIPELNTRYGLEKNMGYGTKQHLDGILEHGITQWHRKTYARCKDANTNYV